MVQDRTHVVRVLCSMIIAPILIEPLLFHSDNYCYSHYYYHYHVIIIVISLIIVFVVIIIMIIIIIIIIIMLIIIIITTVIIFSVKNLVDLYGKDELIYLGPDEQVSELQDTPVYYV